MTMNGNVLPDRRGFLLGTAGAAVMLGMLGRLPAAAQDKPLEADALVKAILKDAKPIEGRIAFELPEIAENGNTVPYSILVESPMTQADHVKAVHIIATGNPQPQIATFNFTPESGKASAASRMRLGRTQDIIAVAELADGKFLIGKRMVKVTIGGCGG